MDGISNATNFISSLSSTGLMALMVVVLALVVKNFYEKSEEERKKQIRGIFNSLEDIKEELRKSNQNLKYANDLAIAQKEFLKKSIDLQMENNTERFGVVKNSIGKIQKNTEDIKNDTNALKGAAARTMKTTETLVNLYRQENSNK